MSRCAKPELAFCLGNVAKSAGSAAGSDEIRLVWNFGNTKNAWEGCRKVGRDMWQIRRDPRVGLKKKSRNG